jgi:hypothetical protein
MTRSIKQTVMHGSKEIVLKQEKRSRLNVLLNNIGCNSLAIHIRKEKEMIKNNRFG